MTTAQDLRFAQTLAEVKASRPNSCSRPCTPAEEAFFETERRRQRQAIAAQQNGHRFDVSLCTGYFRQATGGQWLNVTRQQARQAILAAGLERVTRTSQTQYVLLLSERDHNGKEIGYYECRVGSFPGIKLTDWEKELKKLPKRGARIFNN